MSLKKVSSGWKDTVCCCKICTYILASVVPSQTLMTHKVTHGAMGTDTPIYHQRGLLLNFVVAIMSMVLLPFTSKGHNSSLTIYVWSRQTQRYFFYFTSIHLRWVWVPKTLMGYTPHISFLLSNFRCNGPFNDNEPKPKPNKWQHIMLTMLPQVTHSNCVFPSWI